MLDLLKFGVEHVLVPLVVWPIVFASAALAAGVVTAVSSSRSRSTPGDSAIARSRSRVWIGRVVLGTGCFLFPLTVSVFHAVPFAISHALASGIERATPGAVGWMTDLVTTGTLELLELRDEDTAVDVQALRASVTEALKQPPSDAPQSTFARIKNVAQTEVLHLIDRTLARVTPATGRITWRELARQTREYAAAGGTTLFATTVLTLRATAALHLYWAIGLTVLSQVAAAACYCFLIHPRTREPESPSNLPCSET